MQTPRSTPPPWMIRVLRAFCHADYLDEVQGDLEEMYFLRIQRMPKRRAQILLFFEILQSFKTYIITGDKNSYPSVNQHIMFRNYLIVALRNLNRNKLYSFINILGLSIGLTCSVLIFLFVANEWSFDQFHTDHQQIFRVNEIIIDDAGNSIESSAAVPWAVGPALQTAFPQATVTRMYQAWQKEPLISRKNGDRAFYEDQIFFVDSSFFRTFSFDVLKGNPENALARPQSVVLTESSARKYFGTTDVLGKNLILEEKLNLTVTAVTADVPENSHFHYDFLIPLLNIGDIFAATGNNWGWTGWYWNPVHTYVRLPQGLDAQRVEMYFEKMIQDNFPPQIRDLSQMSLQPLAEIHFTQDLYQEIEPTRSRSSLYLASAIAFFILVIAGINFVNLSTATATKRAKEVGVRKVLGSTRTNLIMQFYGETILFCLLGLLLGIIFMYFLIPPFEQIVATRLNMDYLINIQTVALILLGTILLGVIAGSYPALILSRFKPAEVLKVSRPVGKGGITLLRRSLVVFQFVISVILLFSSSVVYLQHNFLTSKQLGFDKDQIIMLPIRGTTIKDKLATFKKELSKQPEVIAVSAVSDIIGQDVPVRPFAIKGYEEAQNVPGIFTDHDFVRTFGISIAKGRDFSLDNAADVNHFLINKSMLELLKDPNWEGQPIGWGRNDSKIIGMVEDFNYMSLKNKVRPLLIGFSDSFLSYVAVRVQAGNTTFATIESLEKTWKAFEPEKPFVPFFLDDKINELYQSEEKTANLISSFSLLSIIIALLGLIGLVTYRVNSRIKEIGIRKIMGASTTTIIGLLAGEFLLLIIIANLIALPGAWYLMQEWLDNFAYRLTIPWWLFLSSGSVVLLIALITAVVRSLWAARMNPVQSVRRE